MKKVFNKFLPGALILLIALNSFGKGKVTGRIIDSGTNESLIGAAVSIQGTTIGVSTNLDGSFTLEVPEGKQVLSFSFIGYIDKTREITVSDGQPLDLGIIKMESSIVGLEEVLITASFARDRKTPVSLSTIEPLMIAEKLGSQEFPEILKTTPSIYATKDNGGFGDAQVRVRGFDTYNVGVLINGIPVNGMENSKVYWSNWAGLSDVTQTIQVQRGLGASKLGLSSVGGTINVITKSTDAEKGGSFYTGMGNSGYRKQSFTVSTGLMDNGWAVTLSGVHTYGDGYIRGLQFDGYSYFANVSKLINDQHRLSFTVFGAPQTHNNRNNQHTIEWYRNQKYETRANSDYGIREGKPYGGSYGYNYYHKPQASLNHYWNINSKTLLTNVLYASIGRGGSRIIEGEKKNWLGANYTTGEDYKITKRTALGLLDFEAAAEENANSVNGSQAIIGNSVNNHSWAGLLSTLTTEWKGLDWTIGFDGRYYKGEHYEEIDDLLGGSFYIDTEASKNVNQPEDTKLKEGDKIEYYEDGIVLWGGLFLQGEYVTDKISAFLSVAVSNQSYRRVDYFQYTPGNQKSDWKSFLPWNVKGGANYNINANHNVFLNAGYIKRSPTFNNVFLNYTNEIIKDVKHETVITTELGYGYKSRRFNAKVSLYRTNWLDKALVKNIGQEGSEFIPGINALHQGVEVEATYKPTSKITLNGMFSLGDWVWQDDVSFTRYDDERNVIGTYNAYIADVHVGNSAQSISSLSADFEVLPNLKIGIDYVYLAKNYADYEATNRINIEDKVDAWEMPDVGLVDMNFKYKFKIGGLDATAYGKVNNLLNTEYVADASDGSKHDQYTSLVYYGFGTTWSTGLKVEF